MYFKASRVRPVLVVLLIASPVSLADEELEWWGYEVVDELTGELTYGVTKSYISMVDERSNIEKKIGFWCYNGEPMFTFDLGEFVGPSSTDFTVHIWIDDNPSLVMDMRVWSDDTNGGSSKVAAIAKRLFVEMRAGYDLRWRVTTRSWSGEGAFSLIGFTAASREFAANCSL